MVESRASKLSNESGVSGNKEMFKKQVTKEPTGQRP